VLGQLLESVFLVNEILGDNMTLTAVLYTLFALDNDLSTQLECSPRENSGTGDSVDRTRCHNRHGS